MKRTFQLFTLLSLFLPLVIQAQESKHSLGIEGGPSYTMLWGDHYIVDNYNPALGFSTGITYQYHINHIFSIKTGLGFEQIHMKWTLPLTDIDGNITGEVDSHLKFNYNIIPLLGSFTFGQKLRYFVNMGPYYGFLISAITETKNIEGHPDTKSEYTEYYKRSDWGISAGLGIAIPIASKFSLSLEVRNNLGLSQINTGGIWEGGYVKTNATNLLVGAVYHFPM